MVLVLLGPADEDAAVAIQPGVSGLDDPAAGAPPGSANLFGKLLPACADVRGELVLGDQVANFGVVICLVQADPLRLALGWLRAPDRD